MKTFTTNISSRWIHFFGVILMFALMAPVAVLSQPSVPVLTAPLDEQINVTTSPTLSWNAATGVGPISYQLQVSSISDFSTTVFDNAALTGLSQLVAGLANGTIYYWHVSAADDGGTGSYSTTQSFTINPIPVDLGTAADFRILANTGITGGAGSSINGDIGVTSAASTLTGFSQVLDGGGTFSTSASVVGGGKIYAFDYADPTPTKMTTASSDMGTAYTNAANRTPVPVGIFLNAGSGEIGNLNFGPGLYKWTSAVTISNDLTLTGNSTDVWIFQLASTLGMANGTQITLVGGALSSNIFWQVAGQVTLIGTSSIKGIILGQTGIAMGANGTLDGRALAQTNVTLITNGVFPVELVSFTASANNTNVNLHWSTATEVNNFGFEIERTEISNQQSAISWKKIGFVEGHGTTNAPQTYSFTDANAAGTVSYRLKQVDRDGKFEYSQSVEVSIGQTPKEFALMQNYPNQFNPSTTFSFSLSSNSIVSLKVFDALGREVSVVLSEELPTGMYNRQWNGSALPSGVYFYRLTANAVPSREGGSFTETKNLLLLK